METVLALKVNDKDNVATVFSENIIKDTVVEVRDKKGHGWKITALQNIPYGHKIALEDIPAGTAVIKYGEALGQTSQAIARGSHVHVHNLDSMRGRGDL